MVAITNTVYRGIPNVLYYSSEKAAEAASYGAANAIYIVCSARMATDIFNRYGDDGKLERGLKDGWLKLAINPSLFDEARDKMDAVQVANVDDELDDGWFRLYIIPRWGRR